MLFLLIDWSEQGGVKVILELRNKNSDHGSHIQEVQLWKVSRLKCVYYTQNLCSVQGPAGAARLPVHKSDAGKIWSSNKYAELF